MAGTDSFFSQDKGKGNPFADRTYSDQFVRSATQPLQRKGTRPLGTEALEKELAQADEQMHLCRVIIERFNPRIRLLRAAYQLTHPAAAPDPKAKGPKKPTPHPLVSLSPPERKLSEQIAQRLKASPGLDRRVAIALTQYDNASASVHDAAQRLDLIRSHDPAQVVAELETLQISKLQGQIYPICNLYEVFKDEALLLQLFPAPQQSGQPSANRGFQG